MKRKNTIGLTLFFILFTTVSCSTKYRNMQSFETVRIYGWCRRSTNGIGAIICPITYKVLLYSYKFRNRTVDKVLAPVAGAYRKPVADLIDEKSMSCSELFASSMQAAKRVVLLGDRSPGYLLGANWLRLMNGGSFMHAFLQPLPADGRIIEYNGVKPDIAVSLDRNALLDGRDTQLEAAIACIGEVT